MIESTKSNSYLFSANGVFVEELYNRYLTDPNSVDQSWQEYFANLNEEKQTIDGFKRISINYPRNATVIGAQSPQANQLKTLSPTESPSDLTSKAILYIKDYRKYGHFLSRLDPLHLEVHPSLKQLNLEPADYGFIDADYDKVVDVSGWIAGKQKLTLRELFRYLTSTYSGPIALEFDYIDDQTQRKYLTDKMENLQQDGNLTASEKLQALQTILEVEGFEQFVHSKFTGEKRFSVEGGENSMAAVEFIIDNAARMGMEEIIIGMPHRGRLDVLTKVVGKPYEAVLGELLGKYAHPKELDLAGDVKYHMGWSTDRDVSGHQIHLSLTPNPSHLEAVNPVVLGKVRAKQDLKAREVSQPVDRSKVMGLLLHGDAAFAGQGVVMETFALADLNGYTTGGTIHIVVNNQIGFTATAAEARKHRYATEIAKIIQAPIFHVNGDDAEAVVKVAKIAIEYRQKFNKDVVIDVICYRLHGHNEGDEPFFTQPVMYKIIHQHPSPVTIYGQQLIAENILTSEAFEQKKIAFKEFLNKQLIAAETYKVDQPDWLLADWAAIKRYDPKKLYKQNTGAKIEQLKELGLALCKLPDNFKTNSKIIRLFEAKKQMIESGEHLDWSMAESLAFAACISEGTPIRLTGQDCCRGTFSHRHSVLIDQENDQRYTPLNNLNPKYIAKYEVINSNLSEYGVLGFEYGYSITAPHSLVLWEAQFGDFVNGAQIIIDQFICSAETKWLRMSGLVVLLPHGYEGQGPEHSSARLERFLQLCAEDNMQVVNCSTPASYFHALRRQVRSEYRKPLIIMTPKSLLRHKYAVSKLGDMAEGTSFNPLIVENDNNKISKVIICSGKVYYDLLDAREKLAIQDVSIIRLEQFYPFPAEQLAKYLSKYKQAKIIWCQEEHKNGGGWEFVSSRIREVMELNGVNSKLEYVGRKESSSTAAGYKDMSLNELAAVISQAYQ